MSKHTPGPWIWDGRWLSGHAGGLILWYTSDDNGVHAKPEDARLIAAAPELLAALQSLLDINRSYEWGNPSIEELEAEKQARAAIAKATGSQP